jgi:hypothetical protein
VVQIGRIHNYMQSFLQPCHRDPEATGTHIDLRLFCRRVVCGGCRPRYPGPKALEAAEGRAGREAAPSQGGASQGARDAPP